MALVMKDLLVAERWILTPMMVCEDSEHFAIEHILRLDQSALDCSQRHLQSALIFQHIREIYLHCIQRWTPDYVRNHGKQEHQENLLVHVTVVVRLYQVEVDYRSHRSTLKVTMSTRPDLVPLACHTLT